MKTHPSLLTALFLVLSVFSASAQENNLDTLLSRYFDRAASLLGEGCYDSSQFYFDKAFATPKVETSSFYPILLNEQGTLHFFLGELDKARESKKQALGYLHRVKNLETHVSIYNDLGILYHRHNMTDSSLYYYNKAIDAAEKYNDASWTAHLHTNVSVFYFNLKQYEKAEQHIDQALAYVLPTGDREVIFRTLQLQSSVKAQMNKRKESQASIRQAWRIACEEGGNAEWKLRCIPGFYSYFKHCGQRDSITYYLNLGNELIRQQPPYSVAVTGFIQVRCDNYYQEGNYREALQDLLYLNRENSGSNKTGLYERMARCYQKIGQSDRAFMYMDSARMWTDSLNRQSVTSQMAEMDAKFKNQNKKLRIANLEKEVLKRESYLLKGGFLFIVLLVITLVFIVHTREKQQKADKELARLKQEKELTAARSYIDGLEEECKYFAKELHDGIANDLLSLQMKIELSDDQMPNDLVTDIDQIRNNVRTISHELMPPEFERCPLQEILAYYADTFTENTGVHTSFYFYDDRLQEKELPHGTARELYRIVQEITSNLVKHTSADEIELSLTLSDETPCQLVIQDNAHSPSLSQSSSTSSGIGLRTVDDRVKTIHGTTCHQSAEGVNRFILTFHL